VGSDVAAAAGVVGRDKSGIKGKAWNARMEGKPQVARIVALPLFVRRQIAPPCRHRL